MMIEGWRDRRLTSSEVLSASLAFTLYARYLESLPYAQGGTKGEEIRQVRKLARDLGNGAHLKIGWDRPPIPFQTFAVFAVTLLITLSVLISVLIMKG